MTQYDLFDFGFDYVESLTKEQFLEKIKPDCVCKNCSKCSFYRPDVKLVNGRWQWSGECCTRKSINEDHPEGSFTCHDENICDELLEKGIFINNWGDKVIDNR